MSMSASEEKCDTEKIVPRADQADLRFGCARLQDESGAPGVRPRRRRPRLRPKRRRDRHRNAGDDARPEGLGCPPSGVRVSQHVKGGWATSLLTDAFLPRILTSFSLCGCSRTAIRRRDPTGSAVQRAAFSREHRKPLLSLLLSPSSPAPLLSYQRRSRRHNHTRRCDEAAQHGASSASPPHGSVYCAPPSAHPTRRDGGRLRWRRIHHGQ